MKELIALTCLCVAGTCTAGTVEDCFVKKATWRESLMASRAMLFEQELKQDQAEVARAGIKLGDWYVAPIGDDIGIQSKDFQDAKGKIDVSKPLTLAGRTFPWTKLQSLTPDTVHDITKLVDMGKSSSVVLCNTVTVSGKGSSMAIMFSVAKGWVMVEGCRSIWISEGERNVILNGSSSAIPSKKGTYQVVALINLRQKVLPYVWYHLKTEDQKIGTTRAQRSERRRQLFDLVASGFKNDPLSRIEMQVDKSDKIWPDEYDWTPGKAELMEQRYANSPRLGQMKNEMPVFEPPVRQAAEEALKNLNGLTGDPEAVAAKRFYMSYVMLEADKMAKAFKSMRLAIADQEKTFKDKYPKARAYLSEVDALEGALMKWLQSDLSAGVNARGAFTELKTTVAAARQRILLDNPLLKFEKLLVASGGINLAVNWGGASRRLGRKLQVLSPVTTDGKLTTIREGDISSYELDWDAKKILFSDGGVIAEMDVDGKNERTIKGHDSKAELSERYNPSRMPGGDIMFVSTACEQAVPCTGEGGVGNLHVMDKDGNHERRLTFDQDHNWDPCVLNNGRVVFTRWEYTDLPHYFSRLLMSMNPDGTDQKEYYGSASYWPTAMYWARPIPGHPTRIVTIVSGHHGATRMGELHLLDPALGRLEADGSVQQIPGYGKKVEPRILDRLVDNSWPKFITPYPLGTSPQEDGAGTYFLATVMMQENAPWQLCLVDIFDNITPILEGAYAMPVPVLARQMPPVVRSRVDVTKKTGTAMVMDIYNGPGVQGFPKGSIKALRVGSYHYRYPGNGATDAASYEGCWDIRRILGTVPVDEDGSAFFEVPANMPIFVQPLDADGQALQVMRSWFTCQPGENLSCIGCHESQNTTTPLAASTAVRKEVEQINPWNGPMRGYSFDREVQPVLDRKCAGCHDGKDKKRPDFRAKRLHKDYSGKYSPAYMALQKYVRRAGLESDLHMPSPGEFQADTSHLAKMLKKGHHNVRLARDEWDRIYTWIDFNIPYPSTWGESHKPPQSGIVTKRFNLRQLFSGVNDAIETTELPLPEIAAFEAPPKDAVTAVSLAVDGWPFEVKKGEVPTEELDLGGAVKMKLSKIGAGKFVMGDANGFADEQPRIAEVKAPFSMGCMEVSLEQYRQFDPRHVNKFIDPRGKNVIARGVFDMDSNPNLPVVRISQEQALAFCAWLSKKSGRKVTLPTEEQWEWACRAGSGKAYSFGDRDAWRKKDLINIADSSTAKWNYGRAEEVPSDSFMFTKPVGATMPPNAWGLYDMHGNVAEWTTTDYTPLKDVGGAKGTEQIPYKVVKGGSWNDLAKYATAASRWRYPKYQPVYDVGFRVVVEP